MQLLNLQQFSLNDQLSIISQFFLNYSVSRKRIQPKSKSFTNICSNLNSFSNNEHIHSFFRPRQDLNIDIEIFLHSSIIASDELTYCIMLFSLHSYKKNYVQNNIKSVRYTFNGISVFVGLGCTWGRALPNEAMYCKMLCHMKNVFMCPSGIVFECRTTLTLHVRGFITFFAFR